MEQLPRFRSVRVFFGKKRARRRASHGGAIRRRLPPERCGCSGQNHLQEVSLPALCVSQQSARCSGTSWRDETPHTLASKLLSLTAQSIYPGNPRPDTGCPHGWPPFRGCSNQPSPVAAPVPLAAPPSGTPSSRIRKGANHGQYLCNCLRFATETRQKDKQNLQWRPMARRVGPRVAAAGPVPRRSPARSRTPRPCPEQSPILRRRVGHRLLPGLAARRGGLVRGPPALLRFRALGWKSICVHAGLTSVRVEPGSGPCVF